ncbi:copper homeostasis membrane protein CopD [Sphingobium sp. Ant17]|uniref:copper homeostasis membrane protein CopD n=1 Tax=Sphingobium sp. Ant17 TaxID=1461752 RepID=UPI0004AF2114|nr:copper homeostasis membrane protein CopD [Sphingobium sp. Ant17]
MLVFARFGLMADLTLLMGLPLFWWAMGMAGSRVVLVALALGGMALSALWLLASGASMTGTPMLPPDWATAEILLTMTPIGPVLAVRAAALLAALGLAVAGRNRLVLIPAAVAAATIAWTGHAGATEAMAGTIHRAADVAHIWAACGWIGALAALLHAVTARRPNVDRVAVMLAKFALLGTVFVATLVVTGVVNSLMIVGIADLPALAGRRYGWLLGAKLLLFAGMLGLAALNRWRLTPTLERGDGAIGALRLSLAVETSAAIAIMALVALLGTLDPMG